MLFVYAEAKIDPKMSREEIMEFVNSQVTDEELQAHALQAMKDRLGFEFDRKSNPHMPEPQYYRPKVVTGI